MDFDPEKDRANLEKHGISLTRAGDMDIVEFSKDERFDYGEVRYRAWGYIDNQPHFLAFAVRNSQIRPISLRRAPAKEMKRYAKKAKPETIVDNDNPEWTTADFAEARPASELPADILAQFPKTKIGRPKASNPKIPVKLRLDGMVVDALRATGPGWQTRINDLLKARIRRGKVRFEETKSPIKTSKSA